MLQADIDLILSEIYKATGYNFNDYALTTVKRRLQKRLLLERLENTQDFIGKIQGSPEFSYKIMMDFSINVTEMFRDPHFFRFFREQVISEIKTHNFIRIWVAGCSTGEEVFSLIIVLYEMGLYGRYRIYATDMNEHVLFQARTGAIPLAKMQMYEQNYIVSGGKEQFRQYFTYHGDYAHLRSDLLYNVLFSHHNLVDDRSFNEFQLIFCRNVLIYFNKRLQDHVHGLIYESMALGGYLALGAKESIRFSKHAENYTSLDSMQKIYKRIH
jgi:chemotaxis protein methyltransferase CheR